MMKKKISFPFPPLFNSSLTSLIASGFWATLFATLNLSTTASLASWVYLSILSIAPRVGSLSPPSWIGVLDLLLLACLPKQEETEIVAHYHRYIYIYIPQIYENCWKYFLSSTKKLLPNMFIQICAIISLKSPLK